MHCLLNDQILPVTEATVGINDLALIRGYGIFDFFRLQNGIPVFMDDHLDRFYQSAEQVHLTIPHAKSKLKELLKELFESNNMPESGIRMVLTGGPSPNGFALGKSANLIVTQEPISFPSEKQVSQGEKLITYVYLRELPHVKTTNYMTAIWLQDMIKKEHAYDVVYIHQGHVLELTRSNIFIVNDRHEIITPRDMILHGITRKQLIKLCGGDYKFIERPMDIAELFAAKEVFITGTTKKVLPITQIDEHKIRNGKPGEITRDLIKKFDEHTHALVNS